MKCCDLFVTCCASRLLLKPPQDASGGMTTTSSSSKDDVGGEKVNELCDDVAEVSRRVSASRRSTLPELKPSSVNLLSGCWPSAPRLLMSNRSCSGDTLGQTTNGQTAADGGGYTTRREWQVASQTLVPVHRSTQLMAVRSAPSTPQLSGSLVANRKLQRLCRSSYGLNDPLKQQHPHDQQLIDASTENDLTGKKTRRSAPYFLYSNLSFTTIYCVS